MQDKKVSRLSASNSDVDALRQHYAETLKPVRLDPIGRNKTISAQDLHISIGSFDIWSGHCSSGMSVAFTEPPDLYALYVPLSGKMEFKRGKSTIVSAPGSLFACDLSSIDALTLHEQRAHIGIAFDKRLVTELHQQMDKDPATLTGLFKELQTTGTTERLAVMCKMLWENLEAEPEESIGLKSNEMLLQCVMLKLFETVQDNAPSRETSSPAMPRHMKIAIDYMIANVASPVTLEEISNAAGVSARALQLAFSQFKETTPLSFLRDLRLQHARIELLKTRDENVTITVVARRWGFSNVARFSILYLRKFGETPRQTIQRL